MKPISVLLPPRFNPDSPDTFSDSATLYLPSPYESVESMPEDFFETWVSNYHPYIQKQIRSCREANATNQ